MTLVRVACAMVAAVTLSSQAYAQPAALSLDVANGRVTLDARNVPVGQILDRWARTQRLTIVNGDRLPNGPVTLRLDGVPEGEVLAILLRDASGYIATRRMNAAGNGFELDRILIALPSRGTAVQAAAPRNVGSLARRAASATARTVAQIDDASSAGVQPRHEQDSEKKDLPRAAEEAEAPSAPSADSVAAVAQAAGLTPAQRALLEAPAIGVYSGEGPPNQSSRVPISAAGAADDLSRYDGMGLQPSASPAGPFGVERAAAQPGAVPGKK